MNELTEIQIDLEDDFADFNLPLVSSSLDEEGVRKITCRGKHGGSAIGFLVSLGSAWDRQDVEDSDLILHWGQTEIISLGAESDAFVRLLNEAYGSQLSVEGMCPRVPFLAVSLAGNPARLEFEPVRMKFFYESDDEERYAEFYLNIDLNRGSIQFREKDEGYRNAVVLALCTKV